MEPNLEQSSNISISYLYTDFEAIQIQKISLLEETIEILEAEDYCDTATDLKILLEHEHAFLERAYCSMPRSKINIKASNIYMRPAGETSDDKK